MEKVYLDNAKKILSMLGKGANLMQTDEGKSEFSYKNKRVIVSTPYLKRLIHNDYRGRTIGGLTLLGNVMDIGYNSREDSKIPEELKKPEYATDSEVEEFD